MRQIPTLVLPGGEVMTESAAILIWLGDLHRDAGLAPRSMAAARRPYLRWMSYVSSAIYALHWIKPDVRRIGAPPSFATRWWTRSTSGSPSAGAPWTRSSTPAATSWATR